MSLEVTEELLPHQPPESAAIIRLLLAEIERLRAGAGSLKKTPRKSTELPSTERPHAKRLPQKPKSTSIAVAGRGTRSTSGPRFSWKLLALRS